MSLAVHPLTFHGTAADIGCCLTNLGTKWSVYRFGSYCLNQFGFVRYVCVCVFVCMSGITCVPWHTCRSQRQDVGSHLPPCAGNRVSSLFISGYARLWASKGPSVSKDSFTCLRLPFLQKRLWVYTTTANFTWILGLWTQILTVASALLTKSFLQIQFGF